MSSYSAEPVADKATASKDRPEHPQNPPAKRPDPWFVRSYPKPILDMGGKRISGARRQMLETLEGYCRGRCWCFPSNADLAARYGADERATRRLLKGLEDDGIIWRVEIPGAKKRRAGIVLLKRIDPDLPTADVYDSEIIAEIEAAVLGRVPGPKRKPRKSDSSRVDRPCSSRVEEPCSSRVEEPTGIRSLSFEEDKPSEKDNSRGDEKSLPERQRQEPEPALQALPAPQLFEPKAMLALPAPSRPAAGLVTALAVTLAAPQPPASMPPRPMPPRPVQARARFSPRAASPPTEPAPMTPGQLDWLATLSPEQRVRFDGLSAKSQASLLAPHSNGVNTDRIIAEETARALSPWQEAPPPPPVPATTAELLAALPGSLPSWPQMAAEAMVQDFGEAKDRKLWAAFGIVTQAVWRGSFPVEAILDAYRQGMKAKAKGMNAGAVFNTALQRDHGWRWNDAP